MRIILASKSPRRAELLKTIVQNFEIIAPDTDEDIDGAINLKSAMKNLARAKAESVYKNHTGALVIAADTLVVYKNKAYGKPKDKNDALKILKSLSGNKHFVYTAYCIRTQNISRRGIVKSTVIFNVLSDEKINEYINQFAPFDKAGAYGIQDDFPLVGKYNGSLDNIIGLPTEKIAKELRKLKII